MSADQGERAGRLRVTEVFSSLQGEAASQGRPTCFIRLTGCPLRCVYCDTEYAFTGGEWAGLGTLLERAAEAGLDHVCVTGGEPLAQPATPELLRRLCDAGYAVSLETSGALDVSAVDPRVTKVIDLKTPASGEAGRNRYENLQALAPADQVKFVLCDRADYDWAKETVARYRLTERCEVLMTPAYGRLEPRTLAEWVLADRLPVRFQIQLHKLLWGETAGH